MSNPDEFADDAHNGGAVDPQDAADEAFLFAIARNPVHYEPLTDADNAALGAWINGAASPAEADLARSTIRRNLAAKEFVLSLRLEQAAGASPPVPARVSKAIVRRMAPPDEWRVGNFVGLQWFRNWRLAGLGAVAAAAIVMLVVIRHPNGPDGARFQVAALSDRSILGDSTATVTRGASRETRANPAAREKPNTLEFAEADVPTSTLRGLFADRTGAIDTEAAEALAKATGLSQSSQGSKRPRLIFDREIAKAVVASNAPRLTTLRIYDLTIPGNAILTRVLPDAGDIKAVFVTLPP